MENRVDAHLPYSTAKGYVQSAYVLMNSPDRMSVPDDMTFFLSLHMLWGFAVELYLKSFLMHRGWTEKKLRSIALRHNLQALAAAADEAGLKLREINMLVELLGEKHASFGYRYAKPDGQHRVPKLNAVFASLSALDEAVDKAIGASVSRGRTPGGPPGHWTLPPERNAVRGGTVDFRGMRPAILEHGTYLR